MRYRKRALSLRHLRAAGRKAKNKERESALVTTPHHLRLASIVIRLTDSHVCRLPTLHPL